MGKEDRPCLILESIFSIPISDLFCLFLDMLELCISSVNEKVLQIVCSHIMTSSGKPNPGNPVGSLGGASAKGDGTCDRSLLVTLDSGLRKLSPNIIHFPKSDCFCVRPSRSPVLLLPACMSGSDLQSYLAPKQWCGPCCLISRVAPSPPGRTGQVQ